MSTVEIIVADQQMLAELLFCDRLWQKYYFFCICTGEARITEMYIRKHKRLLCSRRFFPAKLHKRLNDYTNIAIQQRSCQMRHLVKKSMDKPPQFLYCSAGKAIETTEFFLHFLCSLRPNKCYIFGSSSYFTGTRFAYTTTPKEEHVC